ncbi:DNRLRE domain-containing protein [Lysinibacillus sp. M3]|uniref:DNRLRE domain-containing protein n=1 Tax=Lysinibacillus zambalensis TaxID=3160866 RepID=A0ABV1MTP7_9BACI
MEEVNANSSSQSNEDEILIDPIENSSFINIEYEVKPNNKFKAKFKLYAVDDSDISTELTVRQFENSDVITEIVPRAFGVSEKETYINIVYRGNSDVVTEIQPYIHNYIETEIEIPPHNRMSAIFDVQQPPIVTDVFNPTQDAFTREKLEYQSINYGDFPSMIVGRSDGDIWRSFVQFDLKSIHSSYILTDAKLRLRYDGVIPKDINLELLNADKVWSEYGITHLNRPVPIKLISNQFTINEDLKFIEFNVFDIVKDWVALNQVNNGFIIRMSVETTNNSVTFKTRESSLPPELIVDYYDSRIFSTGRSDVITEIFVYKNGESDKTTEITVGSTYEFSDREVIIYVHRKEVPLDVDIFVEITVTKEFIPAELTVSIPDKSEILATIDIRLKDKDDKVNSEISISRPNILTEISCTKKDHSEFLSTISISKPDVVTEIIVPIKHYSDIYVEIEANDIRPNEIPTEITVSRESICTEIIPRVKLDSNLYTEIIVSKSTVLTEIYVNYTSDILVEIEANIKSDIPSEISVSKPNIESELKVRAYDNSQIDTEIFVAFTDDILIEIISNSTSHITTEIDVNAINQVNAEISISKPIIYADITVPTKDKSDVLVLIEPRILTVDNIPTIITVNGKVTGYVFIM